MRKFFGARSRDSNRTVGAEAAPASQREAPADCAALEERHYSVQQLADAWSLSPDFVRRLFQHEPGVTEWVRQERGKRRYRVLRIPQSVAERVYRRALAAADPGSP